MVTFTLNGQPCQVEEGTTLLEAATAAGYDIPTLCYLKDLNVIGSCRVCLVHVEGDGMVAACNAAVKEGMVVTTQGPEVTAARRNNLKTIMDNHRALCASCIRQETCALRNLCSLFDIPDSNYPVPEKGVWDETFPLQRDSSKCITCQRCVAVCHKVQHCGVWNFTGNGPAMKIITRDNLPISEAGCSLCGQCITHCPTGALTARTDVERIFEKLLDPEVMTVVQVAPAVRTSWGEGVGLTHEFATPERLVAALRAVGFDKVFDTDFGADLTIMEEGSEFVEFMKDPDAPRPMFTSCCPGWVRFVNMHYPQFVSRLSSSKSPHQMLGAVIKNTLHDEAEAAGKRIFNVSIMPCVAKKYECSVPELSTVVGAHGEAGARLDLEAELTPDVDAVLTVREFNRLLRMMGINCAALPEEEFDSPLGQSTGAATIFGRTGGVMEAALRTAAFLMTGEKPTIEMCDQRDATPDRPWTSKELNINGSIVRIGVASGLENTSKLLEAIDAGEVEFDFVEIMACPGGCVGGGGQPIEFNKELHAGRARILNTIDNNMPLRYSHENSDIQRLYAEWIGEPCNHVAHDWLHTNQLEWTMPGRKTACSSQSE